MSGGYFQYKQYQIQYLIDEINELVYTINKWNELLEKEKEKILNPPSDNDFYTISNTNFRDENEYEYITDIEDLDKFEAYLLTTLYHLKQAYIYVHRLDWFLSGDDGEKTMYERLKEDLEKLNYESEKENS